MPASNPPTIATTTEVAPRPVLGILPKTVREQFASSGQTLPNLEKLFYEAEFIIDFEGRFLNASPAGVFLLGCDWAMMQKRFFTDFIAPADLVKFLKAIKVLLKLKKRVIIFHLRLSRWLRFVRARVSVLDSKQNRTAVDKPYALRLLISGELALSAETVKNR